MSDVVTMFGDMRDSAEDIHTQFENLKEEGNDSGLLRGDAATQFRDVIDAVAGTLSDVPRVAGEAHDILSDHLTKLEDLHERATEALARANTRWEDYQSAQTAVGSAETTNTRLQGQADSLPDDDPGAADASSAADDSATALATARGLFDDAGADLEASKSEWGDLHDEEDDLNDQTGDDLGDIDLGDLSDPSWWEKILGAAFDLLMDLTMLDELFALIEAIASGDWAAALWMLKDILDTVMMIVAVVALFTPLGPLVLALSIAYLAVTATLYFTQWPNPETGQTMSAVDVAFAAADCLPGPADVSDARRALGAADEVADGASAATRAARGADDVADAATPPAGAVTPPGATTPTTPTRRYNRQRDYGGAQTNGPVGRRLRTENEGVPCPTCNRPQVSGTDTAPVPEHDPPLAEHYYDHGGHAMSDAERRAYASSEEAFDGTRCLTCQRSQGGTTAAYTRRRNRELGL